MKLFLTPKAVLGIRWNHVHESALKTVKCSTNAELGRIKHSKTTILIQITYLISFEIPNKLTTEYFCLNTQISTLILHFT